jgi:hypothetical protein
MRKSLRIALTLRLKRQPAACIAAAAEWLHLYPAGHKLLWMVPLLLLLLLLAVLETGCHTVHEHPGPDTASYTEGQLDAVELAPTAGP